ncbi:MAG: hypothetical protein HS127_14390 [Planctomycetia bacterium]|nr:hypothetical protein [Planctomycetia bacterium]
MRLETAGCKDCFVFYTVSHSLSLHHYMKTREIALDGLLPHGLVPASPEGARHMGQPGGSSFAYMISVYTVPYVFISATVALFLFGIGVSNSIEKGAGRKIQVSLLLMRS